jgi:tetratricopeptide (TPR) repeat protein
MSQTQTSSLRRDAAWLAGIVDNPHDVEQYLSAGHQFSQKKRFAEAEACYRKAIELNADSPIGHNNLGWVREMQHSHEEAIISYQKALQLDPHFRLARRNLAMLLVRMGRQHESVPLFHEEMRTDVEGANWMTGLVTDAMQARDLTLAGEYATILAGLRWGSTLYPPRKNGTFPPAPVQAPEVFLTVGKLRHDIDQFLYLKNKGVLGNEYQSIIHDYQHVIDRLTANEIKERVPLDHDTQQAIGHVYNRIVHVRHTPRLKQALSEKWNGAAVEDQYLNKPPGIVVIDDFLSPEALESIRLFCLESTIWSGNRYAHGRLGAFFHDGFNCPLLLQIAEELRNTLPNVIGDRYPLRQLWGFKNGHHLPANSSTHADFAAVNVNFWITPEEANLDANTGGLVIYSVDAPLNWDFKTYNGSPEIIRSFLQQQQAKETVIPYRQNRAIIFNSDLFHETAEVKFRQEYENRRINITLLYGDRENDMHYKGTVQRDKTDEQAWRSAAFSTFRRR